MGVALKKPPIAHATDFTLERAKLGDVGHAFLHWQDHRSIPCLEIGNVAGGSNRRLFGRHRTFPLMDPAFQGWDRLVLDPLADTVSPGAQGSWVGLRAYLEEWAGLEDDWDGEGGRAPSKGVIVGASELIALLEEQGAPVPWIYLVGDGEVGFRWEKNASYASASLVDDGDLLIYMHEGDAVLHELDEPWSTALDLDPFIRDVVLLA